MTRTEEEWIEEYIRKEAFWLHDGNRLRPHALLTSDMHSNGFFSSKSITDDIALLQDISGDIVTLLEEAGFDIKEVDCVVGPATGATKLAEAVCALINRRGGTARWLSPTKIGEGANRRFIFAESETIMPGEVVLPVEDVLTTGGSVDVSIKEITHAGGIVLPYIGVIVNRSGRSDASGRKIVGTIEKHIPIWLPDECPLCKKGSEAIRPKTPAENWKRLTARY